MYYAHQYLRAPKKKKEVTVITADGERLEGCFFVSGDRRISDLLNGETEFIPFESKDGDIYILNRSMIARVMPREDLAEIEAAPEESAGTADSEADQALKEIADKVQAKVA